MVEPDLEPRRPDPRVCVLMLFIVIQLCFSVVDFTEDFGQGAENDVTGSDGLADCTGET